MTREELHYRRGTLSTDELRREVAAFWDELKSSEQLQQEVAALGVHPDDVLTVRPEEAVCFRVEAAGLDPSVIALVVAIAPTVNHALTTTWDAAVLPWIRRRRGEDAVVEEPDDQAG